MHFHAKTFMIVGAITLAAFAVAFTMLPDDAAGFALSQQAIHAGR